MGGLAGGASAARPAEDARGHHVVRARPQTRPATPGEVAWGAVVPCALLVLGLLLLAGPPLGRALLAPRGVEFWPSVNAVQAIRPEPVEHARYLIALLGPLLLSAAILAAPRSPRLSPTVIRLLVGAGMLLVTASLAAFLVVQRLLTYSAIYGGPLRRVYFTVPTLVAALVVALAIAAAPRIPGLVRRAGEWASERSWMQIACFAAAALLTANWLLTAINFDSSIGHSHFAINVTIAFSLDETFAVLDGRTPLVDFHAQYGQLWPYIVAVPMSLFGATIATYTIAMATGTMLALLAVYAILRRIVRSSPLALALYLPFLATSFFIELGPPEDRYSPANLLTIFPIRYGGPYLLAWLTARHVDRVRPRHLSVLFGVAGLVAINNPEFGISAMGATLAALLWSGPRPTASSVARLAGKAAIGLLGAAALVAAVSLIRSGSLPRFGLVLEFARLDGVEGWTLVPLPAIGFHLAVFATFIAALAVATVRAVTRHEDVLLTAMLAWAGVFGLGAGSYFVGRSHPEVLIDLFSAWALALTLLLVVVVRAMAARATRLPTLPELAVLFGFGLAVCSIAQIPTPWSQVSRMRDRGAEPISVYVRFRAADRFVASATKPGEKVLILLPLSHRTAYELGLTNVLPWVSIESMPTVRQLEESIAALRRAHGHKIFLWLGNTWPEVPDRLRSAGFRLVREQPADRLMEWAG